MPKNAQTYVRGESRRLFPSNCIQLQMNVSVADVPELVGPVLYIAQHICQAHGEAFDDTSHGEAFDDTSAPVLCDNTDSSVDGELHPALS